MKRTGFWIATGLLVVPVVIFFILNQGTQNFKKLPILGERVAPDGVSVKDTIYYQVPPFSGINQDGKEFQSARLNNSIFIASFFFASCKDVCPAMNRRLAKVYDKYKEFSEIHFVSITVDPQSDSAAILAEYAKRYNADPHIWHFINTGADSLPSVGSGFLLPVSREDKTIDHSQQFILVDKQKRIRGVYDSRSDVELRNLEDDIKVLLYEYHQPGQK